MDLKEYLESLVKIDLQKLQAEVERLRAVEVWAEEQLELDYVTGDRVMICTGDAQMIAHKRFSGWHSFREALAPGQCGIVTEIRFSAYTKRWGITVALDRAWSTSEDSSTLPTHRSWYGPEDECPDGYNYHKTKRKLFYMQPDWVKKAPDVKFDGS